MIGTKLVHVFEGAMRYPIGWVQDCDLVVCYCWCDALGSSEMDCGLFISPCELILGVIAMNE